MFYQDITYAEKVFANNNQAIHKLGDQFLDIGLADYGFTKDLHTATNLDISIDVKPFRNAEIIILSQLENDLIRLSLHNRLVWRGRLSNLHVSLLNSLAKKNQSLIQQLEEQLANKK